MHTIDWRCKQRLKKLGVDLRRDSEPASFVSTLMSSALPTTRRDSLSPTGLRDSHIVLGHSNRVACGHCGQFVPARPHGLWTGGLIVAVPSAEAGDDPGEPSERSCFIGVPLACGVSFEGRANGFSGDDDVLIDDVGCRAPAAIPGVDELDCACCGYNSNGGKLEQPCRLRDLSVLQAQSVALHGAEHLLDAD